MRDEICNGRRRSTLLGLGSAFWALAGSLKRGKLADRTERRGTAYCPEMSGRARYDVSQITRRSEGVAGKSGCSSSCWPS
jgi:hypothetical protein